MDNFEDFVFYTPETTSETTTKKKIIYNKPYGWDKKPKKKSKFLRFFTVMYEGIKGEQGMEPSNIRRFEGYVLDFKAIGAAVVISFLLGMLMMRASGSEKWTKDSEKYEKSYIDYAIEYFFPETIKDVDSSVKVVKPPYNTNVIPVSPDVDSINQLIKRGDSIINSLINKHADTTKSISE